jgi:hypothetical protein
LFRSRLGAIVPRASSRRLIAAARRHPWRAGVAAVALVLVGGVVVDLLRIRSHIGSGRDTLTALSADQLNRELVPTVRGAAGELERADTIADRSPFLAVVGVLPGARGQVEGLRSLTEAATDLGRAARRAADAVGADLDEAGSEPEARVRLLDTIRAELDRVEADATSIDLGPRLIGPIGSARAELQRELDDLPDRFAEARTRLRALSRVLRGPTRYLVLAANNAEMRGGAGMPLSAGVLTINDGDLEFGEFEQIANRWPRPIERGLVPDEYATTYHQFRMGESWLQTAVSPNFEAIGPVYDAMSAGFPGFGQVDGVLEVDVVTLRHLLAAIGPVEVDGVRYTSKNVQRRLLNLSYLELGRSTEDREVRHDAQGEVASRIFEAMKSRDVDLAALSRALRTAAAGRHLLAYADDPDIQAMFEDLHADGSLPADGLMVTVQNIAASKLDFYINPTVSMRSGRQAGSGAWDVRLTVRIPNPQRSGDTGGVESYKEGYPPGVHRAMVAVYLPAAAYDIRVVGGEVSEAGPDPPLQMIARRVFIDEGAERYVAFDFTLPPDHEELQLLPSARVRPVMYTVDGAEADDSRIRVVRLGVRVDELAAPTAAAAVLAALGAVALVWSTHAQVRRTRHRPLVAARVRDQRVARIGLLLYLAAAVALVAQSLIDAI